MPSLAQIETQQLDLDRWGEELKSRLITAKSVKGGATTKAALDKLIAEGEQYKAARASLADARDQAERSERIMAQLRDGGSPAPTAGTKSVAGLATSLAVVRRTRGI